MAGDEVFDRNTLAACRAQGCDVHVYYPAPVSRLREAAVLATGVLPYQRTGLRPNTIVMPLSSRAGSLTR